MEFKNISLRTTILTLLIGSLSVGLLFWKFTSRTDISVSENNGTQDSVQSQSTVPQAENGSVPGISNEEDAAIQEQFDSDRRQQKETKDLKIKLEQTNLELEQEKALAQINDLKKENRGAFNDPAIDGQNNLPEIKVDYIGGDSVKKEAILSIGGVNYQVKEKSSPTDNIQVVSISDSSVTVHISAPQDLIKTIEYKPE